MGSPEVTITDRPTSVNPLKESGQKLYTVWSPDGIPIYPEPALGVNGVVEQIYNLLKQLSHQGYYTNVRQERLAFHELIEHLRIEEHDMVMSPSMAYTVYIQDNLERIGRDGWVPVCYEEFLESEEFGNMASEALPSSDMNGWTKFGDVGVDSGQLLITDPCYLESQWRGGREPRGGIAPAFRHTDGTILFCTLYGGRPEPEAIGFDAFDEAVGKYGKTVNQMRKDGDVYEVSEKSACKGEFSYAGCCDATIEGENFGELNFERGHSGAGVAFSSGFGDGHYAVYGKIRDMGDWGKRIAEVRIVMIDPEEDEEKASELISEVAAKSLTPTIDQIDVRFPEEDRE